MRTLEDIHAEGYAPARFGTDDKVAYYLTSQGDVPVLKDSVERHDIGWTVPCALEKDIFANRLD